MRYTILSRECRACGARPALRARTVARAQRVGRTPWRGWRVRGPHRTCSRAHVGFFEKSENLVKHCDGWNVEGVWYYVTAYRGSGTVTRRGAIATRGVNDGESETREGEVGQPSPHQTSPALQAWNRWPQNRDLVQGRSSRAGRREGTIHWAGCACANTRRARREWLRVSSRYRDAWSDGKGSDGAFPRTVLRRKCPATPRRDVEKRARIV